MSFGYLAKMSRLSAYLIQPLSFTLGGAARQKQVFLDFDVIDAIVIDFDLHDNWFLILMVIATDPAHF